MSFKAIRSFKNIDAKEDLCALIKLSCNRHGNLLEKKENNADDKTKFVTFVQVKTV